MASLYIKDHEANVLAETLAAARGLTKTAAVKLALRHELERAAPGPSAQSNRSKRDRILGYLARNPLPADMGPMPGKTFYDELWGEAD